MTAGQVIAGAIILGLVLWMGLAGTRRDGDEREIRRGESVRGESER